MADLPYRPASELQQLLDDLERNGSPLDTLTSQSVAQLWLLRELAAKSILAPIRVGAVRDTYVSARNYQIPIRLYTPLDQQLARDGKLPILLYYHGGGWCLGSIAAYDSIARTLANDTGAMVISCDYRLAPEHPFPAAVIDAHLVLEWAARNADEIGGDAQRIALAGDSAGGTLATVTALRGRKAGLSVVHQSLFYPSVDISRNDYPSYEQYGQKHLLTRRAAKAFRGFYLPDPQDWRHPDASPLLLSNADLKLMPPALIMTCGCDIVRDEGEAYAARLRTNDVPVTYRFEPEMIHGCLGLLNCRAYPQASQRVDAILADLAAEVRRALA